MMKKPLNRAIRPIPPYGELAPMCGHELQADPEHDRPGDEQEREQELRVRVRDPADPADAPPSVDERRLQDDADHQDHDDGARSRTGWAAGRRSRNELHGRDASRWAGAGTVPERGLTADTCSERDPTPRVRWRA